MKVKISIDKLALSTKARYDIRYPYKNIPGFKFKNYVVKNGISRKKHEKHKDKNIFKYRTVMKFKHVETGNVLIISNQRKKRFWAASPIYIIFYPSYSHTITYPEVYSVEQFFFKKCGINLNLSVVHLAVDLAWKKRKKGRYKKILQFLRPGNKRPYQATNGKQYKNGQYFGAPYSSNQLLVYNKGRQLQKVKDIEVTGDLVRIELRLKIPQMKYFIQSINDLAVQDWSILYPKYFSFHLLSSDFMVKVNSAGESWRQPIWKLRNFAERKLNIFPSNFYRDCLIDFDRFSTPVREALATYRWCSDYQQYFS